MTGTAFDVTYAVQRRQHVFTELGAFVDDGINHVRSSDVCISRDAGIVSRHIQQFVHYEFNFTQGSLVSWHRNDLVRSEEHTSELQSRENLVCRLLLEKKNNKKTNLNRTSNKKIK